MLFAGKCEVNELADDVAQLRTCKRILETHLEVDGCERVTELPNVLWGHRWLAHEVCDDGGVVVPHLETTRTYCEDRVAVRPNSRKDEKKWWQVQWLNLMW